MTTTTTTTAHAWGCVHCLILSHDHSYSEHPASIDAHDIAFTDWDYCFDHHDDCGNCESEEAQRHYDDDDGVQVYGGPSCDLCGERYWGELYRYIP